MGLAKRFKEDYNTSGKYIGINVIKDLPLINVHF